MRLVMNNKTNVSKREYKRISNNFTSYAASPSNRQSFEKISGPPQKPLYIHPFHQTMVESIETNTQQIRVCNGNPFICMV
jgi:hypothetical protein